MSNRIYKCGLMMIALVGATAFGQPVSSPKAPLRHEGLIDAPVAEVWKAFTTTDGLKSWMAPHVSMDLRVGGKMLVNYRADGTLGDENTIENTILSFEPQRMISIQATRPPAGFPFAAAIKDMWSVMYFEPVGADRTRVTLCGMGFKDDEESVKMREFFDKGNAYTIEQLRKKFMPGASTSASDPLKVLHQLVGGEWIFEDKRPNGGVFRGRSTVDLGPDAKSLVARGWLGDGNGMSYHAATHIWRDPETSRVRFQSLDEQSGLATGEIDSKGDNTVCWDWNLSVPGGRKSRYRVEMVFADADHYEFVLHEVKSDGTTAEQVRVKYARVAEAPDAFRRLKPTKG